MNAITAVMTGMASDLLVQILVIVAALALIVGVSVLVNYGFKKLRSVGGGPSYGGQDGDGEYWFHDDDL